MPHILLVEDDPSFGYILSEYLGLQSYAVTWASDAASALRELQNQHFQLAILDVMLPDQTGFELAAEVKRIQADLPFIFLSARSLKIDQLKGYKVGAVDYITKPVDEELLLAKIKVLLGTHSAASPLAAQYQIGSYHFDVSLQALRLGEKTRKLTQRETALLELLCQHENQLLPRKKALRQIWGSVDEFSRKSMDVFISHLRKYLSDDPRLRIENVHGTGFIFRTDRSPGA